MTPHNTIQLITFDLDHTLWNPNDAIAQGEQHSYAWLCEQCPAFADTYNLEMMQRLRQSLADEHHHLQHRISQLRIESSKVALQIIGVNAQDASALATAAFTIFIQHRNRLQLFEHAEPLLAALKSDYTLGALSNGNACLDTIGLRHYFDFHYTAEQLNAKKPLPQQFAAALRFADVAPAQMVHIGDNPVDDIHGAALMGIRTIWYNPEGRPWDSAHSSFTPDAQAQCLSDIPALMKRLETQGKR